MKRVRKIAGIEKINDPREISYIKRVGKKRDGVYVILWKTETLGGPRVGVIAGRGFENSVRRNLARRRVAGCVIESKGILRGGTAYLLECKPGSESSPYQELAKDVRNSLMS